MAVPEYIENCIGQVRSSVYGKDMRKPLADGIEGVRDYFENSGIVLLGSLNGVTVMQLQNDDYRLEFTFL